MTDPPPRPWPAGCGGSARAAWSSWWSRCRGRCWPGASGPSPACRPGTRCATCRGRWRPDSAIIGAFTVALWVAWAVFVACLVAEVAAEARAGGVPGGRRRPAAAPGPPPGGHGGHDRGLAGPAGGLVAALAPAPAGDRVRPAPAAPPAPRRRASGDGDRTAQRTADGRPPEVGAAGHGPAAPDPGARSPCVPGDSPWALAQEHLGDGARWTEIWELNRAAPSPTADPGRARRRSCPAGSSPSRRPGRRPGGRGPARSWSSPTTTRGAWPRPIWATASAGASCTTPTGAASRPTATPG